MSEHEGVVHRQPYDPETSLYVDPSKLFTKPDQTLPASSGRFTHPVVAGDVRPLQPSAVSALRKASSPGRRKESASRTSKTRKIAPAKAYCGIQRANTTPSRGHGQDKSSIVPSGSCSTSLEAGKALDVLIKFFLEQPPDRIDRSDLVVLGRLKERVWTQVRDG